MKRPTRIIKRESELLHRGRALILIVPPTCDVLTVREKGRRTKYEISILDLLYVGARREAERRLIERKAARKRGKV